jgi:MoaA/NifB/PqqE/SkfB family radical SAM enzyme
MSRVPGRILSALFGRRRAPSAGPSAPRRFVVLPTLAPGDRPCDAAAHLFESARLHAAACAGEPVGLLVVESRTGRVQALAAAPGTPWSPDRRDPEPLVLMNAAFLLADPPPIDALVTRARERGFALCGARSTRDLHAVAYVPTRAPAERMTTTLRRLVAGVDDDPGDDAWRALAGEELLPAAPASCENSPASVGLGAAWARRPPESPRYLNTALRELLDAPAERGPIEADPLRMARALEAQRETSRVPWIFNTLLNDIEWRLGTPEPASFPPELHLSLTGLCDLECRFCGYAHDEARRERVTAADVERLDFLRHARVLRLNSSLGEPTLDRHLPAIVRASGERFAHLGLNLFTNGVGLHRPGIIPALVDGARWVSVSLNAATRETWRDLCRADLFDQVCRNVRALADAKRERRALLPLLFGTTVLSRRNVGELPRLPALCRELGIDRLTGFPFYAFEFEGRGRLGAGDTLAACRREYDAVYDETVREAERHQVSLELPAPSPERRTSYGLEVRPLFDFARIETNEWTLGRLLGTLRFEDPPGAHCAFLWRQAAVGSTRRTSAAQAETHYLYPCLGPLCHVDLSAHTPFRFPDAAGFQRLWRDPLLRRLRDAQRQPGLVPVCDACRGCDTRDPREFARLHDLVAEYEAELRA